MKFHVVTTMNAAGWEETGRRMAQSFTERWTTDATLTVYAEGFVPDVADVEVRKLPAWLDEFKAKRGPSPMCNGIGNGRYDYRFDAVKFAHKTAALTDFGLGVDDGVMIWLDADTYTHSIVTPQWLEGLFPKPAYIAWLDRKNSHPETGFVMFRAKHPYHHGFMESLRNLYTTGDLFRIGETHDAAAIHWVATTKMHSGKIPPPHSLSGQAVNWHHPFIEGPLGQCLDHCKGPRKANGASFRRDLKRPRTEEYWRALQR